MFDDTKGTLCDAESAPLAARAAVARAELERQGWIVIPPTARKHPLPEDPDLVNAWGLGYHAGWRQGYSDGIAG